MKDILRSTIKLVVEDIAISYFPPEFVVTPSVIVEIGDDEKYKSTAADYTAIVAFNGDINGGMNLAAPAHVTLKLAGALAQEEFVQFDDMVADSFGELANMIAGEVKQKLSQLNDSLIELTPPVVATGNNHRYNSSMNSTKQYFTIGSSPFFVEVFY
ncbi:MAG: chemotaxis protein CheX [Magnetococcales bacterium]|nr:chemotaxis protein CheX [Magnetococcales bacterium]